MQLTAFLIIIAFVFISSGLTSYLLDNEMEMSVGKVGTFLLLMFSFSFVVFLAVTVGLGLWEVAGWLVSI